LVDHSAVIFDASHHLAQARYRDILAEAVKRFGAVVQTGPFSGMTVAIRSSWGDGDLLSKLLGCYEAELHEAMEAAIAAEPDVVVNIGAAEGYYSVGLACRLPNATVHAFDTSTDAQSVCREAARLNGVERRVDVGGHCAPETLQRVLARGQRPLVVCDCEGEEVTLLDPARVPALLSASVIVECHEFVVPNCTQAIGDRLVATHDLAVVTESGRNPNAFPFLQRYSSLDRWIAVCEFRPCMMHWLIATPKQ